MKLQGLKIGVTLTVHIHVLQQQGMHSVLFTSIIRLDYSFHSSSSRSSS